MLLTLLSSPNLQGRLGLGPLLDPRWIDPLIGVAEGIPTFSCFWCFFPVFLFLFLLL